MVHVRATCTCPEMLSYENAIERGPPGPTPVFIGPFRLPLSLHFGSDCQNVKTGSEIEAKLAKQAI